MTKRSAVEAIRDEIAANEALLERLEEQRKARTAREGAAHAALVATVEAITEARETGRRLATSLSALEGKGDSDAAS